MTLPCRSLRRQPPRTIISKELDWLVGEWVDESDEAVVHTTCQWSDNQAFLLRSFRLRVRGKDEMSGTQRIGWDPRLKQIRSWVFDSDGGFSEGLWTRDGERWVIKTAGVLKDGRSASATNILTRINRDHARWASVDRTLGGEVLADAEEIALVRTPPQPHSARPRTQFRPAGEESTMKKQVNVAVTMALALALARETRWHSAAEEGAAGEGPAAEEERARAAGAGARPSFNRTPSMNAPGPQARPQMPGGGGGARPNPGAVQRPANPPGSRESAAGSRRRQRGPTSRRGSGPARHPVSLAEIVRLSRTGQTPATTRGTDRGSRIARTSATGLVLVIAMGIPSIVPTSATTPAIRSTGPTSATTPAIRSTGPTSATTPAIRSTVPTSATGPMWESTTGR